jgi:hypothetical protein
MIHQRAIDSYTGDLTANNYSIWVSHWLRTAEQLVKEFEQEGLPATAGAIGQIIADQSKYVKDWKLNANS